MRFRASLGRNVDENSCALTWLVHLHNVDLTDGVTVPILHISCRSVPTGFHAVNYSTCVPRLEDGNRDVSMLLNGSAPAERGEGEGGRKTLLRVAVCPAPAQHICR